MSSFASLGLAAPLLSTLAELAYSKPTPIQARAIPAVLAGRDVLAAARTGTGKTAAFALPLLSRVAGRERVAGRPPKILVLTPTRELAEQVHASFCRYGAGLGVDCALAFGGMAMKPQMAALKAGADVLVATPGRLLDLLQRGVLDLSQVGGLVLDEADRMLDLGFARELAALAEALPLERQTLLFSATFSDAIKRLAADWLGNALQIEVDPLNTTAAKVRQSVVTVDKKRKSELFLHLWQSRRWRQALVFVKTRKGAEQLLAQLLACRISADAIHGDRVQADRLRALGRFQAGEVQVLVATDVAARGLDIAGLPLVVNFDLPMVAEDYIHRIGRTGRAGAEGTAVSLVCADEAPLLAAIEALIRRALPREEEGGFESEHRVPATTGASAKNKPKVFTNSSSGKPPRRPPVHSAKKPGAPARRSDGGRPATAGRSAKPRSRPR